MNEVGKIFFYNQSTAIKIALKAIKIALISLKKNMKKVLYHIHTIVNQNQLTLHLN